MCLYVKITEEKKLSPISKLKINLKKNNKCLIGAGYGITCPGVTTLASTFTRRSSTWTGQDSWWWRPTPKQTSEKQEKKGCAVSTCAGQCGNHCELIMWLVPSCALRMLCKSRKCFDDPWVSAKVTFSDVCCNPLATTLCTHTRCILNNSERSQETQAGVMIYNMAGMGNST